MSKIIAFTNQKGGVGKTTTTINLAAGLTKLKQKVLVIDLDPQLNLTYGLGIEPEKVSNNIHTLLHTNAKLKDVIIELSGLSIIPSTSSLSAYEIELLSKTDSEYTLKDKLTEIKEFDYVFIDCSPSLGLLTLNAMTAADEIYIPLQAEPLSLRGTAKLIETTSIVIKHFNSKLQITGIIPTMYNSRKKLNNEILQSVKDHFGKKVFETVIRNNVSLAEATGHGKTIFEYSSNSNGAKDYLALSKEMLRRENGKK